MHELSDEAKQVAFDHLSGEMERSLEEGWETLWNKILAEMARRADPPPEEGLATMKGMLRGAYLEGFFDGGIAALNHATSFRETFMMVDSPGPPPV